MKNWILDKLFNRDEKVRQAFIKAHQDIMSTMQDDIDAQAEELAKKKLQDLLSPVDMNSVVRLDNKGILSIGNERADAGRLANLKAEAEYLATTDLWNLLYQTPNALAQKAMFEDEGNIDSLLLKGRAMLFTLGTQKKIVEILKSFIPK